MAHVEPRKETRDAAERHNDGRKKEIQEYGARGFVCDQQLWGQ